MNEFALNNNIAAEISISLLKMQPRERESSCVYLCNYYSSRLVKLLPGRVQILSGQC